MQHARPQGALRRAHGGRGGAGCSGDERPLLFLLVFVFVVAVGPLVGLYWILRDRIFLGEYLAGHALQERPEAFREQESTPRLPARSEACCR